MFLVQGHGLQIQQVSQRLYARLTAGGAFVDGFAVGDGLGVGPAAREAALPTLGLGQNVVDLVGNGVALGLEAHRGEAQQRPEDGAQADQGKQGGQQGILCNEFKHCGLHQAGKAHKGQ